MNEVLYEDDYVVLGMSNGRKLLIKESSTDLLSNASGTIVRLAMVLATDITVLLAEGNYSAQAEFDESDFKKIQINLIQLVSLEKPFSQITIISTY